MVRRVLLVVLLGVLTVGGTPAAQGVQTGDVAGFVRGAGSLPLPGATVTVESPALQGQRQAVTDGNGAYVLRGLAPGRYSITFAFTDLKPIVETVVVALGGTTAIDARLDTATAVEDLTVVATTPSVLSRPAGGLNLKARDVEVMPTGRTPSLVAELVPGLTNNTPNVNQVTISGAFAYDNVFLIDGVDVNDNLLARPDDLFIEEAVDETQVLTSGISAEYGRFSGGVVNLVTKRGGNDLSGSFRVNLSNGAWTDETPYEDANKQTRPSTFDKYYEGTLGGAVKRDRVWFFLAARDQSSTTALTLQQTAQPFQQQDDQTRWELKVTTTPAVNHTVQGQYTDRRQQSFRPSLPVTIDANAADNNNTPGNLLVGGWNGVVLSNRFFATAQYSQKRNHPRFGNTSTDLRDSPFLTLGRTVPGGLEYNAPYFDRTDPEDRDNRQLTGSVSYFASRPRLGTHDVKAGAEWFDAILRGGNSQSSTGYIFNADYLTSGGVPVVDAEGHPVPVWVPGVTTVANSLPTRGARMDIKTTSLFVQDRWTPLTRLTVDLGVRYERVRSEATGGLVGANTDTWVPRLGATFALDEASRTVVTASYAHYAGRYTSSNFGRNTTVANPARVTSVYNGPAGQGMDFAPGFTLSNYTVSSGSFPTANIFLEDGMSSPLTKEATLSLGRQLGAGVVRATYVFRTMDHFIDDFIDDPSAAGKTSVVYQGTSFGVFDNVYYRNTDVPVRDYQALIVQSDYRVKPNLQVAGHWTVQLKNDGNFEGEAANAPGGSSLVGNYPELLGERVVPVGRLDDFQRHKVRLWAIYTQGLGRFGSVDISPLWRINSALTYSLAASGVPLSAVQRSRNPGYARLPGSGANGSQTLFFGERGSQEFAGYGLFDLAVNYQIPVWQSVKPWLKVEVLNALNNQKLITWDTTVAADPNSPLDADGLPTGYLQGARFGQATSTANFPRPRPGLTGGRTFFAAFGVRF